MRKPSYLESHCAYTARGNLSILRQRRPLDQPIGRKHDYIDVIAELRNGQHCSYAAGFANFQDLHGNKMHYKAVVLRDEHDLPTQAYLGYRCPSCRTCSLRDIVSMNCVCVPFSGEEEQIIVIVYGHNLLQAILALQTRTRFPCRHSNKCVIQTHFLSKSFPPTNKHNPRPQSYCSPVPRTPWTAKVSAAMRLMYPFRL